MARLALCIQYFIVLCCMPIIIITRALSWGRMHTTSLYARYGHFQKPSFDGEVELLPFWGKFSFFIVESVAVLFLVGAIWHFWKMLELYKQKIYFSMDLIGRLRKISVLLLVWSLYQFFFVTMASLIISYFKMPGERYIMAAIGIEDIIRFFIVLILFMILHVLQEAYKIKEEQDLVV